jgi:hypothetical protein
LQKEALAELLDRWKPIWRLTERSSADGKPDILKLVSRQGSRLEPGETIQASNFAKPMDRDKGFYPTCDRIAVGVPYCPVERLSMQICTGFCYADQRNAAGEQLKFGDPWILGRVNLCAAAMHRLQPMTPSG